MNALEDGQVRGNILDHLTLQRYINKLAHMHHCSFQI